MTSHLVRLYWMMDDVGTVVVNNSGYFDSIKCCCLLDNMAAHINSCVMQTPKKFQFSFLYLYFFPPHVFGKKNLFSIFERLFRNLDFSITYFYCAI